MKRLVLIVVLAVLGWTGAAAQNVDSGRLARRYYVTLTGRIPTQEQVDAFIANPDVPALVDELLQSEGFVRKMVVRWGDLLRIKSEFPSCMWPNAVQAYNKWLTDAFRANMPYDQFVRELLVCSGSNFRVPTTNFYRVGNSRSPEKFAAQASLLFLGRRDHPAQWNGFFTQVKFKSTKEWKEEILCIDIDAPAATISLEPGKLVKLTHGEDYRVHFANWLTSKNNRAFAEAFANRMYFWITGEGLKMPVDDLKADTKATDQVKLDRLTDHFIASGFDIRALAREILLSDEFANGFKVRRMDAETICDALCDITEVYDKYSSRAPEPFTNYPYGTHVDEVCDGTVTTPQLGIFGRPSRDVALESGRSNAVNAKQMLYLLNSTDINTKLKTSPYLNRICAEYSLDDAIPMIYERIISRKPSAEEVTAVKGWAEKNMMSLRETSESLMWALFNTDEFLFLN